MAQLSKVPAMSENAAMRVVNPFQPNDSRSSGRGSTHAAPACSLGAFAAVALLISGCGSSAQTPASQAATLKLITAAVGRETGGIVIQKQTISATSTIGGHRKTRGTFSLETITETSSKGADERELDTNSFSRPGFQQLQAGNVMEIYDPMDNTIYTTTQRAWEAEVNSQAQQSAPRGSVSTNISGAETAVDVSPGPTGGFERELRQHRYRLAGRTSVEGRSALKLVPVHTRYASTTGGPAQILGTVYLSPGSYAPIRDVSTVTVPTASGAETLSTEEVTTWSEYKVLPATVQNLRLVSLTARHPTARVVDSAAGYIRASNSQNKAAGLKRAG
jgi:hypothetical protein